MYDKISTEGSSRAHLGDYHLHHEYYAPVYQMSDSTYSARPELRATSTRVEDALESLRFKQMDDHYSTITVAYANTCQWLFARSEYMDWLDPTEGCVNNGILWIKGKPGAGKTTLMKCAIQHTRGLSESATMVSFFFHARGSALEKSTEGMYRSLLIQIVDKIPRLQLVLDKQWPRDIPGQ